MSNKTMVNKLNNILDNVDEVYKAGEIAGASSGGEIDIPIDQEYDSTSEKAQSGTAVAQAVSSKMDKFGKVTDNEYSTDINIDKSLFKLHQGDQCEITMSGSEMRFNAPGIYLDSPTTSTMPLYISYAITDNLQAVNKIYVDNLIGDIEAAAANIIALQEAYIGGNA